MVARKAKLAVTAVLIAACACAQLPECSFAARSSAKTASKTKTKAASKNWSALKTKAALKTKKIDVDSSIELKDEVEEIMRNPLGRAIASGNLEDVERLIKIGADVNKSYADGATILMFAAGLEHTSPDIVTALIKAGARVKDKDQLKRTALMHAAVNNQNPDMIRTLVKAGNKVSDKDRE